MKSILELYNHILTLAGVLECHVEKRGRKGTDEVYSQRKFKTLEEKLCENTSRISSW